MGGLLRSSWNDLSRAAGRGPPAAPTFQRSLEVGGPWLLSALAHLSKILKADLRADRFIWCLDEAPLARQEAFDGKLILLTSVRDLESVEVVERYKRLANIEPGFRVLKQDIALAPVYHRLPERIRAAR